LGFLKGMPSDLIVNELLFYFSMTIGLAVGAALLYRYSREKKVAGALEIPAGGQ